MALSAGQQLVQAQLVEATKADAQFAGDGFGREQSEASQGEEMTDQRRGKTVGELEFSSREG